MKKLILVTFYFSFLNFTFWENPFAQSSDITDKIRELISQHVPEGSPKRWDDVRKYLNSGVLTTYYAKPLITKLSNPKDELRIIIIGKTSDFTFNNILEIIKAKSEGGYTDKKGFLRKIIYSITISKEPDTTPKIADEIYKIVFTPMPTDPAFVKNILFIDGKIKKGHGLKGPDTKNNCYYFYNYTKDLANTRPNFQVQDMMESNNNINKKIMSSINYLSYNQSDTIEL